MKISGKKIINVLRCTDFITTEKYIKRYFEEQYQEDETVFRCFIVWVFFHKMSGGGICVNEKHYLTKESWYPHFHLYRKLINT